MRLSSPRPTAALALLVLAVSLYAHAPALATADPPVVAIPGATTYIDDIGLYSVTARYRDGSSTSFPMGWIGHFDDATGVSCTSYGRQAGEDAFLLHPPWRGKTGVTAQSFRLALPQSPSIMLRFATAMQTGSTASGKSDGARFRVTVDGVVVLDQLKTDEAWSEWKSNLTAYAGKTVTVTFETDPGPKNSPAFDFALWGTRRIIVASDEHATPPWPAQVPANLSDRKHLWDGAGPSFPGTWGVAESLTTSLAHDTKGFLAGWSASLAWTGDAIPVASGSYLLFIAPDGSYMRSDDPRVTATVVEYAPDRAGATHRVTTYNVAGRLVHVVTDFYPARGDAARVDISSDDPYIAAVSIGGIGPVAFRRRIHVPYYGKVLYLGDQHAFANAFLDFTKSNASDFGDSTAAYRAKTDGTRNPVRETVYYAISQDLTSVLPSSPNPPSTAIADLGKRVVYDIFTTDPFAENAAYLRDLQSYGLDNYAVILHPWQRAGYDVELPDVLPADAKIGGEPGLNQVALAASDGGDLFALHENYEDFYPEAKSYNEADVALASDGSKIPAWKNKTQSYAYKPRAITKYAALFSPKIHTRYATSATFVDVSSSVMPWFHVDFDAAEAGAGKFRTGLAVRTNLWAFERATHHGPVFGEGANHWYYSGLLDGVEAQSNAGAGPGEYGIFTPLLVDFDLLNIHPLQLNHGMGYFDRWIEPTGAGWRAPTADERDRYRMQEIIFGHEGYVTPQLCRDAPFIWQETNLLPPITSRTATSPVTSISYEVYGKLCGINEAIAARAPLTHVVVQYTGGVTVTANGSTETWNLDSAGLLLPPNGWCVQGNDLLAFSALKEGRRVDYAETPTTIFAGTRSDPNTGPADGVVNYGKVATDASFRLDRISPGTWTLMPFPRTVPVTIRLLMGKIDPALAELKVVAYDAGENRVGETAIKSLTDGWIEIVVNVIPGATHYRLVAASP